MLRDLKAYTAVVVDDEPLSRAHLVHLLREAGVGEVLQAGSGEECLRLMEHESDPPDWVFLDVHMPEMDGLALADTLGAGQSGLPAPLVVYVTGYEEYAIAAFEHAAVDYLLKPATRERLAVTLDRLASRNSVEPGRPLQDSQMPAPALQRLPIRLDYAVRLVDVDDIVAATAREKRVDIVTADAVYPTYYTLGQLEARLPAERFVRVHGSWIVNLAEVLEIHNLGSQSYQIRLRSQDRMVPVSRRRLPLLQQRLGL